MNDSVDRRTQDLLRELAPQVLGAVVRRFRDFPAAEDAVQEALIAAVSAWPRDGLPGNPGGWLFQVASRKIADHVRSETARRRRESLVVSLISPEEQLALPPDRTESSDRDDTLELLFMCCHPVLTEPSAIALTLRAVGGLTTLEIAKAFLVPEATMAQRISRAKQSIKESGVPFEMPDEDERRARVPAVLHVLNLIFNEGYTASSGPELHRTDLSNEALRLARLLLRLVPDHTETAGLLALMLLTDARRKARTDAEGELVPLDAQDRTLWDGEAIAEGLALVAATLPRGAVGPYQLQAAIAAVHDEAKTAAETDWPQILALYDLLESMTGNPIVALNRAVAIAMVQGPRAGLARVDEVAQDKRLSDNHRVDAVRAHLHERAGELDKATHYYQRAAERTTSLAEQRYLSLQAARLSK